MPRYYICGIAGSGSDTDPYRPEIADEAAALGATAWAACQEMLSALPPTPGDRFIVTVSPGPDEAPELHAELAYSASNPNGYDFFDFDGEQVSVNAA